MKLFFVTLALLLSTNLLANEQSYYAKKVKVFQNKEGDPSKNQILLQLRNGDLIINNGYDYRGTIKIISPNQPEKSPLELNFPVNNFYALHFLELNNGKILYRTSSSGSNIDELWCFDPKRPHLKHVNITPGIHVKSAIQLKSGLIVYSGTPKKEKVLLGKKNYQLWLMDPKNLNHTHVQLTKRNGSIKSIATDPVELHDGRVAYSSDYEKEGSANIWSLNPSLPNERHKKITNHKNVRGYIDHNDSKRKYHFDATPLIQLKNGLLLYKSDHLNSHLGSYWVLDPNNPDYSPVNITSAYELNYKGSIRYSSNPIELSNGYVTYLKSTPNGKGVDIWQFDSNELDKKHSHIQFEAHNKRDYNHDIERLTKLNNNKIGINSVYTSRHLNGGFFTQFEVFDGTHVKYNDKDNLKLVLDHDYYYQYPFYLTYEKHNLNEYLAKQIHKSHFRKVGISLSKETYKHSKLMLNTHRDSYRYFSAQINKEILQKSLIVFSRSIDTKAVQKHLKNHRIETPFLDEMEPGDEILISKSLKESIRNIMSSSLNAIRERVGNTSRSEIISILNNENIEQFIDNYSNAQNLKSELAMKRELLPHLSLLNYLANLLL